MRRRSLSPALAIAAALSGAASSCGEAVPQTRSLLLITVDTLRADRVGAHGPSGSLTPVLDRLAREGTALSQCVVPVPRTSQSVASLLTGLHPVHHGVRGLFWPLPRQGGETLAERLGGAGYRTAAFTSNVVLRPGQGFERGFSLYDNPRPRWEKNGAGAVVEDALAWVRRSGGDRWFVWVHLLDPHWPYEPAPPFDAAAGGVTDGDRTLFAGGPAAGDQGHAGVVFTGVPPDRAAHLRALYDGEVAATDAAIGRLISGLETRGALDRTLVVVTSDHGESLGEHGYWFAHGEYLYDEGIRVPAIFRAPGLVPAGATLNRLVRTYDLMPTILDLLAVRPPAELDGLSRANEIRAGGDEDAREREIYLESDRELLRPGNPKRFLPGYDGSWRGLRGEAFAVFRIPASAGEDWEAYDLVRDPGEAAPAAPGALPDSRRIQERLRHWEARAASAEPPPVPAADPEHREALRSLGYAAASP